jgi:GNAT superfamily N-acetyltransferase
LPKPGDAFSVRPARPDDAGEVARLAELMYRSLGLVCDEDVWGRWRVSAVRAVRARLGADLTVVVAEDPGVPGHVVACGAGSISERLPGPGHASARVGYIQWMSTEPGFRRRGLGRAVLRALLGWFESQGVDDVELHASTEGAPLYRSEGFWEGSTGLALRRRPWDPAPPR